MIKPRDRGLETFPEHEHLFRLYGVCPIHNRVRDPVHLAAHGLGPLPRSGRLLPPDDRQLLRGQNGSAFPKRIHASALSQNQTDQRDLREYPLREDLLTREILHREDRGDPG